MEETQGNGLSIWKFPLEMVDEQTVEMPRDSKVLSVQVQGERLCLWAAVLPSNPKVPRTVRLHGTGHRVGYYVFDEYLDTVQMHHGSLVLHVFVAPQGAEPQAAEPEAAA